ncbi:hypothetical protein POVCU2_0015340 [Plasmodium ovale curtisi]|uniref:Uncharacterized protein n=1 Tax=Plasmodium ovale curtisi TaxID=864141 RepID=A0A1A8VUC5_PLAOA|nr:hypothetical protein POVCU2_0015340 [Plasmodium ovale curtisi]
MWIAKEDPSRKFCEKKKKKGNSERIGEQTNLRQTWKQQVGERFASAGDNIVYDYCNARARHIFVHANVLLHREMGTQQCNEVNAEKCPLQQNNSSYENVIFNFFFSSLFYTTNFACLVHYCGESCASGQGDLPASLHIFYYMA